MSKEKILVTGATGLVGSMLCKMLVDKGYEVNVLSRGVNSKPQSGISTFVWDVSKAEIDAAAFDGVTGVIHLAGAGIADKRWTDERKQEILDSRTKSTQLIFNFLKNHQHSVQTFLSASAVGYYGDCGNETVTEDRKAGKGFLADVCRQWEKCAGQFTSLNIREVRCRFGIILSKNGGALPELTRSIPFGVASYFSKSPLYYPWVHIDDVCGIVIHALENKTVSGAYNTTAPSPLPMKILMQEILQAKKSKAILLPAPAVGVQIALGEMSEMLLCSQRCSAQKIIENGYRFKFPDVEKALKNLFR